MVPLGACASVRLGRRSLVGRRRCGRLARLLPVGRGSSGCRRATDTVDAQLGDDETLDLPDDVAVGLEEGARVLPALADALAVEGEPGPALLDDAGLDPEVDDVPRMADALAVEDVELDLAERRGELVLHHLDPGPVADDRRLLA